MPVSECILGKDILAISLELCWKTETLLNSFPGANIFTIFNKTVFSSKNNKRSHNNKRSNTVPICLLLFF